MNPEIVLKVVMSGMTLLTGAGSVFILASTLFSIRAKLRAKYAIQTAAVHDYELRRVMDRIRTQRLTESDFLSATRIIEEQSKKLSSQDQRYIHEGIHQHSATGAKRFVREVLANAS